MQWKQRLWWRQMTWFALETHSTWNWLEEHIKLYQQEVIYMLVCVWECVNCRCRLMTLQKKKRWRVAEFKLRYKSYALWPSDWQQLYWSQPGATNIKETGGYRHLLSDYTLLHVNGRRPIWESESLYCHCTSTTYRPTFDCQNTVRCVKWGSCDWHVIDSTLEDKP